MYSISQKIAPVRVDDPTKLLSANAMAPRTIDISELGDPQERAPRSTDSFCIRVFQSCIVSLALFVAKRRAQVGIRSSKVEE